MPRSAPSSARSLRTALSGVVSTGRPVASATAAAARARLNWPSAMTSQPASDGRRRRPARRGAPPSPASSAFERACASAVETCDARARGRELGGQRVQRRAERRQQADAGAHGRRPPRSSPRSASAPAAAPGRRAGLDAGAEGGAGEQDAVRARCRRRSGPGSGSAPSWRAASRRRSARSAERLSSIRVISRASGHRRAKAASMGAAECRSAWIRAIAHGISGSGRAGWGSRRSRGRRSRSRRGAGRAGRRAFSQPKPAVRARRRAKRGAG